MSLMMIGWNVLFWNYTIQSWGGMALVMVKAHFIILSFGFVRWMHSGIEYFICICNALNFYVIGLSHLQLEVELLVTFFLACIGMCREFGVCFETWT